MLVNKYILESDLKLSADTPFKIRPLYLLGNLVKKYAGNERYGLYCKWVREMDERIRVKHATETFLKRAFDKEKLPLFSSIEIETVNRCNGTCSFCPINRNIDSRKFKKMDEQLFRHIIDQLGELNYAGRLALHSNNEPFLDTRIIEFARYARERVPNAFLYLYTNGTLLTMDKFLDIMQYLDKIMIDNYSDALKLHPNNKAILEYCKKNRRMDRRVEIYLRKEHEILRTRGGQAPNKQTVRTLPFSCCLPYKQMVVRPNGKLSLCCNDPLGKYTMGDLNKETLTKVWYSGRYRKLRERLRRGRRGVKLCRCCDTLADVRAY